MEKSRFNELEPLLQNHFILIVAKAVGLFMFALLLLFATSEIFFFFFVLCITAGYLLYHYFQLLQCYKGTIVSITAFVEEVYDRKKVKDKFSFERNHILLKQEDVYVKVYCPNVRKFREGNQVKVFLKQSSLRNLNLDTFTCDNPLLVKVEKTNEKKAAV